MVRIVAPAPGMPPNRPATMLPMPWPISSLSELWWVPVTVSAINEVSRLSMVPKQRQDEGGHQRLGQAVEGDRGA